MTPPEKPNEKEKEDLFRADPEQVLYAHILAKGMYIGLAVLFVTYSLYVFGIVAPFVPLDEVSGYWSMSVGEYLRESGAPRGWGWLPMLKYGDFLNFVGIAILAGLTIVCYAAIIPVLLRRGDRVYAILALLEVLVLGVAASGLVSAGH
jgi:hypothetical protein